MSKEESCKIGTRIKQIRNSQGLTQTQLGKIIGVGQSAIGLYENNKRSVPETVKKAICREFNIDYLWLTKGIGESTIIPSNNVLDQLAAQYKLNVYEKSLVNKFINLTPAQRELIINFFNNMNTFEK